jgi:CBS domain-containing protein
MDLRQRPVSEIMRREVATAAPKETLDLTQDIMSLGRVRHVPVLDEGRLVGILSHRDLLAASLTKSLDFDPASRRSFLRSVLVGEVMTKDPVTVGPETTLSHAARILVQRKIGCLPVVSSAGALIGLVTDADLLSAAFLDEDADTKGREIDVTKSSGLSDWIEREVQELRRLRDELKVRVHLGKAEARERWEKLEKTLHTLESKAKQTSRAAEQPIRKLEQDLRELAKDLREGYRQIRDSI